MSLSSLSPHAEVWLKDRIRDLKAHRRAPQPDLANGFASCGCDGAAVTNPCVEATVSEPTAAAPPTPTHARGDLVVVVDPNHPLRGRFVQVISDEPSTQVSTVAASSGMPEPHELVQNRYLRRVSHQARAATVGTTPEGNTVLEGTVMDWRHDASGRRVYTVYAPFLPGAHYFSDLTRDQAVNILRAFYEDDLARSAPTGHPPRSS